MYEDKNIARFLAHRTKWKKRSVRIYGSNDTWVVERSENTAGIEPQFARKHGEAWSFDDAVMALEVFCANKDEKKRVKSKAPKEDSVALMLLRRGQVDGVIRRTSDSLDLRFSATLMLGAGEVTRYGFSPIEAWLATAESIFENLSYDIRQKP